MDAKVLKGFGRDLDAKRLNVVANDADVRGFIGIPGTDEVDLSFVTDNPRHFVLFTDVGGVVFLAHEGGVYEGHVLFTKAGRRDGLAIKLTRLAVWWMFTKTDMTLLLMKVPEERKDVLGLVRALSARKDYEHAGLLSFSLTVNDWLWRDEGMLARGKEELKELELGEVPEPVARLWAYFADCWRANAGMKGLLMFNMLGRFVPWWPLEVVNPTVPIFRLHTSVFRLDENAKPIIMERKDNSGSLRSLPPSPVPSSSVPSLALESV